MQYQYNLALYAYFIVGLTNLICFFLGKLNTNLQLNTNMKVNSNLWQHVSSFHEGSVAIPLEFPSRIIWSTHWFYKPGKCPRTIYFLTRGL